MMTMSELAQKRTRWEIITLGCMFIGYMGFILSRTVLAVVSPEMVNDPNLCSQCSPGKMYFVRQGS